MTRTASILVVAFGATILLARTASAAVCVTVDTSRDNLAEPDRNAALTILAQTLQQNGVEVSNQNCMGTYSVYNLRLGNSVNVYLQGPQGYRQATARTVEDLPALYSQMVRSLITGQPMDATSGAVVDRNNVTTAQAAPNRVEADSLWYIRLGYAAIAGPAFNTGPDLGFGYRYELDNVGIDASLNLVVATDRGSAADNNGGGSVGGSFIKLEAMYYTDPTANQSPYFGGGISWGGVATANSSVAYSGGGLQGELTAGYELLRASSIRLFGQFNATLPFYGVSGIDINGLTTNKSYAPTFGLSLGLAWGRPAIRAHIY
jgi:hypothetical protein